MDDQRSAKVLFDAAKELGLQPEWVTSFGLLSIRHKSRLHYIYLSKSSLNSDVSSYLAKNKYFSRVIFEKNSLPNIPYLLPQSIEEVEKFLSENKKIIAKPTLGAHSTDVHIFTTSEELSSFNFGKHIFEKYVAGREMRYLVLKDEVIAVHEKRYTTLINNQGIVERISYPKNKWDKKICKTALLAAKAIGLQFAAVDFIVEKNGDFHILEINSSPGLWRFHFPDKGSAVKVAYLLLSETIK